jgi:hypothetical protein
VTRVEVNCSPFKSNVYVITMPSLEACSILGLYPATEEQILKDFEAWRRFEEPLTAGLVGGARYLRR